MFKKIFNLIKNNKEEIVEKKESEELIKDYKNDIEKQENIIKEEKEEDEILDNPEFDAEIKEEIEIINIINNNNQINIDSNSDKEVFKPHNNIDEINEEEEYYIKSIKIRRGKKIQAIDVYSNECRIFETHNECSKKLGIPIEYIKENIEYGYTDYFGQAIKYLSKKLRIDVDSLKNDGKNIVEIFNYLHNQLWSENISEKRREEILSSEKIESVKMHYKFEMIDDGYDEYFKKYRKLIRRGGKKKVELVDKKGEVIEVFKSLDECAKFFDKDRSEIIDRLKCGECKIGRYQIRYSLTR